jgi:uncharacterized Fe-S center protein
MKAQVFYTSLKLGKNENLLKKLERLVLVAGLETIDFKNKFVAIKIHFGEPGNLAYLRPNYARKIVDLIKRNDGRPFLTDCNTLYVGRRKNGLDHLEAAYENGYNPFQTGCHVIIGDGIKGLDVEEVPINLEYVEKAKIGKALYEADIIISMNHFKGHDLAGFGGALKNLGMGGAARAGKAEIHASGKPFVVEERCEACGQCRKRCAEEAISLSPKAKINHELCLGCGYCISCCLYDAIRTDWQESSANMNRKVAEYTYAILKDKPHFHISFVLDVSPNCDCNRLNDIPIVGDIGFLASFDPVALDQACLDLVNSKPLNPTYESKGKDHFKSLYPHTFGEAGLEHAEGIGLGTRKYRLVEL